MTMQLLNEDASILECLKQCKGITFKDKANQQSYLSVVRGMGGIRAKNDVFIPFGSTFDVDNDKNITNVKKPEK